MRDAISTWLRNVTYYLGCQLSWLLSQLPNRFCYLTFSPNRRGKWARSLFAKINILKCKLTFISSETMLRQEVWKELNAALPPHICAYLSMTDSIQVTYKELNPGVIYTVQISACDKSLNLIVSNNPNGFWFAKTDTRLQYVDFNLRVQSLHAVAPTDPKYCDLIREFLITNYPQFPEPHARVAVDDPLHGLLMSNFNHFYAAKHFCNALSILRKEFNLN